MDIFLTLWFYALCAGLLYFVVTVGAVTLWRLPHFLRWLLLPERH